MRELCEHAVTAALGAGADYADARVVVRRAQVVGTRNRRVERLDDAETEGIGVRVLVGGAWGFACDRRLDNAGADAAAAKAVAFAKAAPGGHSRELALLLSGEIKLFSVPGQNFSSKLGKRFLLHMVLVLISLRSFPP